MNPCTHAPTGTVTSHPARDRYDGRIATTPVCDLADCIAEAIAWVARMTRQAAVHVPDEAGS